MSGRALEADDLMSRRAAAARVALAGPVAAVVAVLIVLGMPIWVPAGAGGVDNLVLPLVLFPLVWAGLFFHACLDTKLRRVAGFATVLAGVHLLILGSVFLPLATGR